MGIFYSETTNGFYDSNIFDVEDMPGDAVEITQEKYEAMMDAQSRGMSISADKSGKPVAVDPKPPTAAEKKVSDAQLQLATLMESLHLQIVEAIIEVPGAKDKLLDTYNQIKAAKAKIA